MTISGFGALLSIEDNIRISGNELLNTISGFGKLEGIGGEFTIEGVIISDNASLTSISGFDVLERVEGTASITFNTLLASCCGLLRLVDGTVAIAESPNISGNASGCNSDTQIMSDCNPAGGNITINAPDDVPDDTGTFTRIMGNLTIGGTITEFPDFSLLEVVEGSLIIRGLTTGTLTILSNIFPALDTIRGDLNILENDFVQTISGFAELDSIGGSLNIGIASTPPVGNPVLTTLPSFSSLKEVGEDIGVVLNPKLVALPLFDALTSIGNDLNIDENVVLPTVSGFGALATVGNSLDISSNALLTSISGFGVLTRVGHLDIDANVKLASVSDFDRLAEVTNLVFSNNDLLTALPSFPALTTITGGVEVSNNDKVERILGFNALTSIDEVLIESNALLEVILGFKALTSVMNVRIDGNTSLSLCCGLRLFTSVSRTPFTRNASGCNSVTEVMGSCSGPLDINALNAAPSNVGDIRHIRGDLTISGAVDFPVFASLEAVEGTFTLSLEDDKNLSIGAGIFAELDSVEGDFIVDTNVSRELSGFEKLKSVGGNLRIIGNQQLTVSPVFELLRSVGGDLEIGGLPLLTTLSDFAVLTRIGNDLKILNNSVLTTLPAFAVLTSIGRNIEVKDNAQLATCCGILPFVDSRFTPGGTTTVSNNIANCNSVDEIKANCVATRTLTASPPTLNVTAAAGDVTFDVTANVDWEITKRDTDDFITSISPKTGNDNQQITIVYDENTTIADRDALFTLSATGAGATETLNINLTQAAAARELSADKTRIPVFADAGSATFNVTSNVPWEITQASPVSWIASITPETGSANQQITIEYDENTTNTSREAILMLSATDAGVETMNITLVQSAPGARVLLAAPSSFTPTAEAGNVTFDVTANVPWAITNSDTWITSIAPKTGSDNQTITIEYDENIDPMQREATFTLAATDVGATETTDITLTQAAARFLAADKTRIPVNADAGSATFNVTATVPWEITNSDTWITSITPKTGGDNQTITIEYDENTAITDRDAVLTLSATGAGATETLNINLTQAGATALGLPTLAKNLRFYPNPASQTLYIEGINQETSLIIRTFSGKTLLRTTLHQNQAIDLATLPQGTYLLTLQNAQEQITNRLIINP